MGKFFSTRSQIKNHGVYRYNDLNQIVLDYNLNKTKLCQKVFV